MEEILELNTKISDDDIMGMFAHQSKNIPENDVYAAFEKGVRFAESYYQVELNKRTSVATTLFELVKQRGMEGVTLEEGNRLKVVDVPQRKFGENVKSW